MTVHEMRARMGHHEYIEWKAFYSYRNHLREKAKLQARTEAKAKR